MGQIRIVIDARELRTSTGRYIDRLLQYLQNIKSDYQFIVLLKPKDMESWKPQNKRFTAVPCRHKEFTFAEQIGMWIQLHKLKPDLVHFGMVQQPILYQGKSVTTMHDLTTTRFRNPSKNWLVFTLKQQVYKWVNRIAAHKATIVITPTEFVKDDVARYTRINSRKIVVTPEAADAITEKPQPFQELEDKQFIMYVGRPQPHKNLERLIKAFELLRQNNPGLKLVLVGKKDILYRRLEKFATEEKVKNIVFTDFVSEGQLRWLYEHTAAYVFPSLSEGFGLPGLEAMIHGAPVVSSNATCLPEVHKDAAEYFDPLDIEGMAAAIQRVIDDPTLRKKLQTRGTVVAHSYSWQRMAEQTLEVYKRALEDN